MTNAQDLATGAVGFAATRGPASGAEARPFADFAIFNDPQNARNAWAEIYPSGLATPYQSFDFVETWLRMIGQAEAIAPMIVVVRDDRGRTSAILPFGRRRTMGVTLAEFVGGKHANFHMGVFRPGLGVDRASILNLLTRVGRAAGIDAFLFVNQPQTWQRIPNPFAALGGQPSPSFGYSTQIKGDLTRWLDAHYSKAAQKKLRKKARRLEEQGPVGSFVARDAVAAKRILAAFFTHKKARSEIAGLINDFDDDVAVRFLEAAASEGFATQRPVIELHALTCGERIVAVFGGLPRAGRFCGMITSYDQDVEIARSSPGEILINDVIRDLGARGFTTFDLGVGEARYKDLFCEKTDPLFDTAIPITWRGRSASATILATRRAKRWIKQRPWAWSLIRKLTRRLR